MNRKNTRLAIIALFVLAFTAALGAFVALGNNSGEADSQPVTSSPVSDSADVETDENVPESDAQDQADEQERSFPEIVDPDADSNDVLVGNLEDDRLDAPDRDVSQGDATPSPNGISRWCPSVQHTPPPGMDELFLSGIQLNGEIFSVGYDSIQLQGPTLNSGDPVLIDIDGTQFVAPIGINEFGDHEILTLNLVDSSGDNPPLDLLPTLQSGPGAVFPVGPDEGPLFDQECFEFPRPEPLSTFAEANLGQYQLDVEELLNNFVSAHADGDTEYLFDTLHPAVPESFGQQTCREYIDRTVGSIADARVVGVGEIMPFELDTPQGPIGFPEVVPVDIEFTTSDGNTTISAAHFPLHNGEVTWLTACGVE